MSLGLDFLEADDDLEEITDSAQENPEDSEEAKAEDAESEGVQEAPSDEDQDEEQGEEEELLVIDIDGEEVTLDQIKAWKSGNLREQDYTKKTTALAEERKALSSKLDELNSIHETLSAGESEFKKALLGDLDDIDLKALREEDYPEYLKIKEEIKDREGKFDELKSKASDARMHYVQEQGKQLSALMGWDDESKSKGDIEAFKELSVEIGIDEKDASSLVSARVMKALIDYAHIKKASKLAPIKGKAKKVAFKKSSNSQTQRSKPKTAEERVNSFFS